MRPYAWSRLNYPILTSNTYVLMIVAVGGECRGGEWGIARDDIFSVQWFSIEEYSISLAISYLSVGMVYFIDYISLHAKYF